MDPKQVPNNYKAILSLKDTFSAIHFIKNEFESALATEFNLIRVVPPLMVEQGTGVNDQLDTIKKPVEFELKNEDNPIKVEIVQAATKWKRVAMADYKVGEAEGLWCDMHAVRKDYKIDNTHTVTVDQWDWELRIRKDQKNLQFLKETVEREYKVIKQVQAKLHSRYPQLTKEFPALPDNITFIHSEDLLEQYPKLERADRENEILKKHKAVFIIGIGSVLKNGEPHDARAPDYDDYSTPTSSNHKGLNGDILFWNPVCNTRHEISSMGIRVDAEELNRQLAEQKHEDWKSNYYHKRLLAGEYPSCIGGGIGQSRLIMYLLHKAHIGEVQVSVWPPNTRDEAKKLNVHLL